MTKRKRYKRYSPEFKREALKRASEEGVTDVIVLSERRVFRERLSAPVRRSAVGSENQTYPSLLF